MKINLLPQEVRERSKTRRQTLAVVLAGLVLLGGVAALYMLQQIRLAVVHDQLEEQEAANAALQVQVDELRRFDELQREVQASRDLLIELMANEVHWSGVLRDISLVIPGEAWLSGITASITEPTTASAPGAPAAQPAPAGAPGTSNTGLIGNMQFNGFALDHRAVALWLARLDDVRGFANPWLANSQKTQIGTETAVQFTSSVDLSYKAVAKGRRV